MKWLVIVLLCASAAAQSFPIKVSANGRYFVDQASVPFAPVIDTAWGIVCNLPTSDLSTYISARAAQHVNAIFISVLGSDYIKCNSSNSGTAAQDGTLPFTSGTNYNNYDFSTPNSVYWAEVDNIVTSICNAGLVAIIDPTPSDQTWSNGIKANGSTKDFNFGVFLGNRYKNSTCVMWQHGNDYTTWNSDSTLNADFHQIMLGIASVDTNHIQTIELGYWLSWANQNTTLADVMGFDLCYSYYPTYDCIRQAYASSPTNPVYLGESNYEGENNQGWLPAPATAYDIRIENYWAAAAAAAGVEYGDSVSSFFTTGWQTHLNDPGATQLQYILTLAASFPFYSFTYDSTHAIVTSGYGTYDGTVQDIGTNNYCPTSWNGSTKSITYCPQSATVTVALSQFSQSVIRARWFDPTAGTYTAAGTFANSGTHNFTSPSAHSDGKDDWVLALDAPPASAAFSVVGKLTTSGKIVLP